MNDEHELSFDERIRILEYSHEGRIVAARLGQVRQAGAQTDATFSAAPSVSPDPYRIGLCDGCGVGLSWRGSERRPGAEYLQETAHSAWMGRTPPTMRPTGSAAYTRYQAGFTEGFGIGRAEPISSTHPYSPRVQAILDYEADRKLYYYTAEGRAALEAKLKRAAQQQPYAGADAPRAYADAQGASVGFAATGVLSSSHQQGVTAGIERALKEHGSRGGVGVAELRRMAEEAFAASIRGRATRPEASEWPHYWEGYQAGFVEAWGHQGARGGQGVKEALHERARRQLLLQTDAGAQQLRREERQAGR